MHLTVFCPQCRSRYQLDPSMRGKRMRCPNSMCRTVFEVREEKESAPPAAPRPEEPVAPTKHPVVSGTVGEVVPVLSAAVTVESEAPVSSASAAARPETTSPAPAAVKEQAPALMPPPVRRPPAQQVQVPPEPARQETSEPLLDDLGVPGDDESAAESPTAEALRELEPGTWEAPPVRGAGNTVETGKTATAVAPAPVVRTEGARIEPPPARRSRRRSVLLMALMLVILSAALGVGYSLVSHKGEEDEDKRFQNAQALYRSQDFEEAMGAFQKLLREFPTSKNRRQYDFLVELSAVREAVYAPRGDREQRAGALERVQQFLEIYKNDPILKGYHGDIWHTLQRLARELTTLAEQKQDAGFLNRAKRSWAEASKFTPPAGTSVDQAAQTLNEEFARVAGLLAARGARLELLDGLRDLADQGSADAVREGRALAKEAGLESDPDVASLLEELVKRHREKIVFVPAPRNDKPVEPPEDPLSSFYVAPPVGKFTSDPRQTGVVLAQVRGVLYALDAATGDVRWVRRVGADTTLLPVRVPASTLRPELILVLSSDSKSVSAVTAADGKVVWQHALSGVCLGRPVLVDGRLLVPTLSGRVEEIETAGGLLQGSYALGQPLVVGGVHQPGTSLVIFPADSYSVYVLDVAKRACAAILYTGHAAGSLRGPPLVWNEPQEGGGSAKAETHGWLLLSLAAGAGGAGFDMRPYGLPIRQPDQKPAALHIDVRGTSWDDPWQDGEKLALATDTGRLVLYGIRQKGNPRDPLLFPLLSEDYRVESAAHARATRAAVVHADRENYWVSSAGNLHRLQATFTAKDGPGLVARWPQPPPFGSPLHAAQVHAGSDGKLLLFLVTQDPGQSTCWVRAVEAREGQVLWQRRLGMVCLDQPIAAGGAVAATDGAGVYLFDATRREPEPRWQAAGTLALPAGKATGRWTGARGQGFVHLSWGPEPVLEVRLTDAKGAVVAKSWPLPALPQGTPAPASDFVLLPLGNGVVLRVPLDDGGLANGPDWRGVGVEESQPGHVVSLGGGDFAITDGGRSLLRIRWGDAKLWEKRAAAEMPYRITAAPAALGDRLFVADASDTVTMLEGERLALARRWSLGGKITAGPFVRGKGVGVVVGKTRLVWLNPDEDQPAWEYAFVAPIVGKPELVEGLVVVADLQGGIVGIDPATGSPAGPGYRLKANVAPTAAPVAFGPGRLFVPLMDGTVMLLPLEKLR
jgi:tetratricopeptide (TPR) repeat protein